LLYPVALAAGAIVAPKVFRLSLIMADKAYVDFMRPLTFRIIGSVEPLDYKLLETDGRTSTPVSPRLCGMQLQGRVNATFSCHARRRAMSLRVARPAWPGLIARKAGAARSLAFGRAFVSVNGAIFVPDRTSPRR